MNYKRENLFVRFFRHGGDEFSVVVLYKELCKNEMLVELIKSEARAEADEFKVTLEQCLFSLCALIKAEFEAKVFKVRYSERTDMTKHEVWCGNKKDGIIDFYISPVFLRFGVVVCDGSRTVAEIASKSNEQTERLCEKCEWRASAGSKKFKCKKRADGNYCEMYNDGERGVCQQKTSIRFDDSNEEFSLRDNLIIRWSGKVGRKEELIDIIKAAFKDLSYADEAELDEKIKFNKVKIGEQTSDEFYYFISIPIFYSELPKRYGETLSKFVNFHIGKNFAVPLRPPAVLLQSFEWVSCLLYMQFLKSKLEEAVTSTFKGHLWYLDGHPVYKP